MTSNARRLGGCLPLMTVACVFGLILLVFHVVLSLRMPEDAPLARMYRTEADVAFLKKAIEHYREIKGAYPPPGQEGLKEATRLLSEKANYLPDGAPPDAWGHPYRYVSCEHYADPQWQAIRGEAAFLAPDTYQVYSAGADGDPGVGDPSKRNDNICGWDAAKTWRAAYREANKSFKAGSTENRGE